MSDKTVTRAELVEAVYKLQVKNRNSAEEITRQESSNLVEAILGEMMQALIEGEAVKISSFGVFDIREKSARIGRNPKTGVEAEITPRRVVSFRASHVLKAKLNKE